MSETPMSESAMNESAVTEAATNKAAETDVIVIGAGVSGLACALDLVSAGMRVRVLEVADAPGGRMRTDRRDGFLLDRGFQVFNPSYPQVKRRIHRGAQLDSALIGKLSQRLTH